MVTKKVNSTETEMIIDMSFWYVLDIYKDIHKYCIYVKVCVAYMLYKGGRI